MDRAPFHPVVAKWFAARFGAPTTAQARGWPLIQSGQHTLIAAPTGSGKTLAAFLVCLDALFRQALAGTLPEAIQVVYLSPLKALSNDVQRNLETPLAELISLAVADGLLLSPIRALVRTGDTAQRNRQAMARHPPQILVTTPESLYLLLTSPKNRDLLRTTRTVIVDEIHAVAATKRGSHLALSLARLDALCPTPPQRIGLSATQRPLELLGDFLVGAGRPGELPPSCAIVDAGHLRTLDMGVLTPPSPLAAVCSHEQWEEIIDAMADQIRAHRSTLVFVNTRRLAERLGRSLGARLGEDRVAVHHGSLSKETRLRAEERLKSGDLQAIVATASLELGIDIGFVDLVCQLNSPRGLSTWLQRVGRAGHALRAVPKGRLFPTTRDDLLECLALVWAVKEGGLDPITVPVAPLDILAQQLVAACADTEWREDDLFALCRAAYPYRDLARADFDAIMDMLGRGVDPRKRAGAFLHRDQVNGNVRARRDARLVALTCGGAIPDMADYRVVTAGERTFVGTVHEDFAVEAMAGDVFQLGSSSWRIQQVLPGEVVVEDATGVPPSIPFWLGEAPGRTHDLGVALGRLRTEIATRLQALAPVLAGAPPEPGSPPLTPEPPAALRQWLVTTCGATPDGAAQAIAYTGAHLAATGMVPTTDHLLVERFFDDTGGMQLVIHSPYGARLNRAWGLALRKRFCRTFDFELQATADDNGIVLSLGPQHSFPLDTVAQMLVPATAFPILEQAVLAAPVFRVRWRWNATRSLAVRRFEKGKRVLPNMLRFRADDLLTAVFPQVTACLENIVGDLVPPDHPLVKQTMTDAMEEAMDATGFMALLAALKDGSVKVSTCDSTAPSPYSHQLINAMPFAFLDNAPLEERRARALTLSRALVPADLAALRRLDPAAIAQVQAEAWPLVRDADELHDALQHAIALPAADGERCGWQALLQKLIAVGRATVVQRPGLPALWCATECWPMLAAVLPEARPVPVVTPPASALQPENEEAAAREWVRGQLDIRGPVTGPELAAKLGVSEGTVAIALAALEGEGSALRGHFRGQPGEGSEEEWCERRLLARIHRRTLDGLRRQIQPVALPAFFRFLAQRHQLLPGTQAVGRDGLLAVMGCLQGCEAPAGAWEAELLPPRVAAYTGAWLDELTLYGALVWGRLRPTAHAKAPAAASAPVAADLPVVADVTTGGEVDDADDPTAGDTTLEAVIAEAPAPLARRRPVPLHRAVPLAFALREDVDWLLPAQPAELPETVAGQARQVYAAMQQRGAVFFDDLLRLTRLLPEQLETALAELLGLGLVTADSFAAVRALVNPRRQALAAARLRRHHASAPRYRQGGRWSLFPGVPVVPPPDRVERWAKLLLRRYGVVFRELVLRETVAPAWSVLAPVLRRMEARGELRGGRFVAGVGGEQFAEDGAVEALRKVRETVVTAANSPLLVLAATDPINILPLWLPAAASVPAVRGNALAVRAGVLLGTRQAGQVVLAPDLPSTDTHAVQQALLHWGAPARLHLAPVAGT